MTLLAACSSWLLPPITNGKAPKSITVSPPICSPPTCGTLPPSCCKSTSTAGRSKSTTATRRIPWASDKPSCGISTPYPNSPSWWWPPTALCSWPLSRPSAPNAPRLIRPCPDGDARPTALPALTLSPCCAKKWLVATLSAVLSVGSSLGEKPFDQLYWTMEETTVMSALTVATSITLIIPSLPEVPRSVRS